MATIAILEPLGGKYYGTEITIIKDGNEGDITIWTGLDYEPSIRELDSIGVTQKDWDDDIMENNGWGGLSHIKENDHFPDSHHEAAFDYKLAKLIVGAINGNQ